MLQDRLRRLFLLVGRIAVTSENTLDEHAQVGPNILPNRPVDGYVVANGPHEFLGNDPKRLVAENLDGTIIDLQGIVKRHLVFGQPELFTTLLCLPHVPGQADQYLDDLRRLYGSILVAYKRLLQHFGKRPSLNGVLAA